VLFGTLRAARCGGEGGREEEEGATEAEEKDPY